jgi:hypothetical protein
VCRAGTRKQKYGIKNKTMKTQKSNSLLTIAAMLIIAFTISLLPASTYASGGSGSGGGGVKVDSIKVSKCYCNATDAGGGGEMLIKAISSDVTVHLYAYRPDGSYIGEVQNGGGSRYGGTVMPWQPYDPGTVTIISSSGGSITVPTTPFQI